MDGYDAAFITFGGVFLLLALISYCWEIWERTPWDTVHKSLLKLVFRRKQELTKQPPTERADAEHWAFHVNMALHSRAVVHPIPWPLA